MKEFQRIISGLLALCLVVSVLPAAVWAEESEVLETVPEIAATETAVAEPTESVVMETTLPTEAPAETTGPSETETAETTAPAETEAAAEATEPEETTIAASQEAASSIAASGTCGNDLTWTLDSEGTLTISGTGAMKDYTGSNTAPWNSYRESITTVVLGEGVTGIGVQAFRDCTSLTTVNIPGSVTSIGMSAFYSCTSLTGIDIPDSVTSIGTYAFLGCTGLTEVTIPDSVTYLGQAAFAYCDGLLSAAVGEGVTLIEDRIFDGCDNIKSISLGARVTNIGNSAFCDCRSLENINIPDGIVSVGDSAFEDCESLKSLPFTDSLLIIGDRAFLDCQSLTRFEIPDSVIRMGDEAFFGCDHLESISIPDGMTSIGEDTFSGCISLKSITLPDGLTTIGARAFNVCKSLKNITIPDSVTSIGASAFANCEKLTQIVIPDSVTSIGDEAFSWCNTPYEISFEGDAPEIGQNIFLECRSVKVYYPDNNPTWTSDVMQSYGGKATWYSYTPQPDSGDDGDSGGSGDDSGSGDSDDTPRTVIASGTCGTNLTWELDNRYTLTISGTGDMTDYRDIDGHPWYAYRLLVLYVVLEEGVTSIGRHVFSQCENLMSITIPKSLKTIGYHPFNGCFHVTDVYISDLTAWLNITGDYELTVMQEEGRMYLNGELLTDVVIPEGMTSIRKSAFNYCSSLKSITIPDSVTSIGESAFGRCSSLKSITIPDSVTSIGSFAFNDCTALKEISFQGNAPAIGDYAFRNVEATAYYHMGNATWTESKQSDYGGSLEWVEKCVRHTVGILDAVTPTCTTAGLTEGNCCTSCGEVIVDQQTVPALGHDLGQAEIVRKATCTEDGEKQGACSRCDYIGTETIPATGHSYETEVVPPTCTETGCTVYTCHCGHTYSGDDVPALGHDMGEWVVSLEATCTEDGEKRKDCSRCDHFQTNKIKAPGHSEVTDEGSPATCTEDGLTEGKRCSTCEEVLLAQEVIPATGHAYVPQEDGVICTACGKTHLLQIRQDYILLDLQVSNQAQLALDASPDISMDDILWAIEGDENVILVAQDGLVTALGVGSACVVATVDGDGFSLSARCRVEVAEGPGIEDIQLSTAAITTELYSTDYAAFEILLRLPGDTAQAAAVGELARQDDGIAIESACFADENLAKLFGIRIQDSRSARIVPTEYAVANPKLVAGKYTGKIMVTVQGETYTSEMLTLTVKKTQPKLKATVGAFNSFYPDQVQKIVITGATVTGITRDPNKTQPDWLSLGEDGTLSLTGNAPRKNASGKLYLLVETEEWAIPAAVTLTVKNAYKEPTLKLSAKTINLNTAVKDTAQITVTAAPADYDLSSLDLRLTDNAGKVNKTGELDVVYENGKLTIAATDKASGSYKLHISTNGSKEVAITIKVISAIPTVTYKVKGNPDLNIPDQYAEITSTFKNYNGDFTIAEMKAETAKKQDASELFYTEQSGRTIRVFCAENAPVGAYTLKLKLTLADGSSVEKTARVTVKRTVLKLKLSSTKLTLNKRISDSASVAVTSATKGYTLGTPVWSLMDKSGKNSAEGALDIGYANGKLTVATNGNTAYGATYKLLVKANEDAPAQTLTITIPAENKSTVTAALKAKGNIDVIRDGSGVTLTATYKNCTAETVKEEALVFYKTVGKQTEEVNDLFHYTANADGTFTVTKAEGAKLDHSSKYTVQIVTSINGAEVCRSKAVSLAVKMGTAKLTLTAEDTVLFAKDIHDRAEFRIGSTDRTLNGISRLEIKDAKYQNLFEIYSYGNGEFAIGFKDGKVDSSLIGKSVTINLNVFLEGNETTKVNTTVKVKLTILK